MGDQRRVILVGCGQRKLTHAAPARELYIGALFVAQRRYAESQVVWAWRVHDQLHRWLRETTEVEVLAGARYADPVAAVLRGSDLKVAEPLRGLTLGHRRRRLAEMTAERQAAQEVSRG